jgi:hypothetical protein
MGSIDYLSQPTHNLTISVSVGGTTSPSPSTYVENSDASVSVTAIPSFGYIFNSWTLDGRNMGSANPYAVVMNTSHNLGASFSQLSTASGVVKKFLFAWGSTGDLAGLESALEKTNYTFVVTEAPIGWVTPSGQESGSNAMPQSFCNALVTAFPRTRVFPIDDFVGRIEGGDNDMNPSDTNYLGAIWISQYLQYRSSFGYTGMVWDDCYPFTYNGIYYSGSEIATLIQYVSSRLPSGDILVVPGDQIGQYGYFGNYSGNVWYFMHSYGSGWDAEVAGSNPQTPSSLAAYESEGYVFCAGCDTGETGYAPADTQADCQYALALFMMSENNGNGIFSWSYWDGSPSYGYYPVMNTNFGTPLGSYYQVGNWLCRNFTNCNVQVNIVYSEDGGLNVPSGASYITPVS